MFFRDDVMAWNKRVQGKAPNTHPLKPAQLKPQVQRNVKDCVDRLQLVCNLTPPQCRNAFSLSPSISEFRFPE